METLHLNHRFPDGQIQPVIEALENNIDCINLSLTNNNIDSRQAAQLFSYLKDHDRIKELNLAMNHIGQIRDGDACAVDLQGVDALANYLKHSQTLEVLHINANYLGRNALEKLSIAVADNMSLKKLYIGSNPTPTAASSEIIFESMKNGFIQNTSLETVVIAHDLNECAIAINHMVSCDYQTEIMTKFLAQNEDMSKILYLNEEEHIFLSKKENMLNSLFGFLVQKIKDGVEFEGSDILLEAAAVACPKEYYCAKLVDIINLEQGPFANFNPEILENFKQDLRAIAPHNSPQDAQCFLTQAKIVNR